ncbi:Folylpolyglutamate synthase [Citrus sinensis]|nr:folylpolyglutamate synthase isoform X1 [Citrus sinensis]XP_052289499.1 folylpolyglutamate synthase isoform X1 [Citrus sinensis]KAH9648953.1 Folylpolyglutamate synthase [Citrus sinensis]
MLVHSNTTLNCGIFGVLHFRNCQFSMRKKWSFTSLPASLNIHDLTGNNDLHQMTKGLRYAKMSSQVKGKTVSNALTTEYEENLPLSSSYENAMQALSSLITRQKRGEQSHIAGRYGKLQRMSMYLKILGLEDRIAELKVIHVSGTKGKGSTCTFCEAILRECGFRTGLFTSPHLIDVRERFRINGLDITEDKFLFYFWECWHLLRENVTEDLPMPPLFQFLTVLAFKIFVCEQVDVAIIEVGLGGEKDSTNVIKEPVVCGVTSLGMDHMEVLGNTLNDIAFHKAGIFKPQIPAFTVPQLSEAMSVLQDRALELMVPLEVAAPLDIEKLKGLELSLSGDHQLVNAGLAVSLSECWLRRTGNWEKVSHNDGQGADLPDAFVRGLSTAHLLGRAQIVYDISLVPNSSGLFENSSGELIFYLDGAHTAESMEACAKWFSSVVKGSGNSSLSSMSSTTKTNNMEEVVQRNGYIGHKMEKTKHANKISKQILLFNCMEARHPQVLLPRLVSTCASSGTHFSKALFVPSVSTYSKVTSGSSFIPLAISGKDLSWQFSLQRLWERIIHGADPVLEKSSMKESTEILPPCKFLYEDAPLCSPAEECFACSAVIPSLPLTIKWLRDSVQENPSIRVQVLVTGSLHLVGDVLKLLKR